jgi:serine/threonine protein kinase
VKKLSTKETMVIKVVPLANERLRDEDHEYYEYEYNTNRKAIETKFSIWIKLGQCCKFLVQIFEIFFEKKCCCLVMEFCDIGNLQRTLNNKKKLTKSVRFIYFFICLLILSYLVCFIINIVVVIIIIVVVIVIVIIIIVIVIVIVTVLFIGI